MRRHMIRAGCGVAVALVSGWGAFADSGAGLLDIWERFAANQASPPFSFVYDGRPSASFIHTWKIETKQTEPTGRRATRSVTYTDPETGLRVSCEFVLYPAFKTVEWAVFFINKGAQDTPIISDIQALDISADRSSLDEFVLHYNRGDSCDALSYEPLTQILEAGSEFYSEPTGGRPTNGAFPYFNLRAGAEGVIIAVGWPGQWVVRFSRDAERAIHLRAGQGLTHFRLHPGEQARTPLIVLQFSGDSDWITAQNVWRRWMIEENIPKPGGKPLPLPMVNACSSHQFAEMTKANEQNQIEFIDSYAKKGLKLDYWWMDAGWYVGAAEKNWPWTGTWEVDRSPGRFPNGLRAISDYAHRTGVKIIVWFEPERVAEGTWLATQHPEWIFGGAAGGLLNLGNPEAWRWAVEHFDQLITSEGIDLYRQDFNIDPLEYWRRADAEDRQGLTENKHVMGYLAYWDELLRRHPGMLIDSCASGGRRNDLETMRRAVPLLRSDYLFEPVGQQNHTYGLSLWLPFYGTGYTPSNTAGWGWGTGERSYEPYIRRSNMCPSNICCFDFRAEVDDELILRLYREWLEVGPNYFGDYYPLTPYSAGEDAWMAVQFNMPSAGQGHLQVYRRNDCPADSIRLNLRGLEPGALYAVKNFDSPDESRQTGQELMDQGLLVTIPQQPGAAVVAYRKDTRQDS